jgi:hypothetical protein
MKTPNIGDAVAFIREQGITESTDENLIFLIRKAITQHAFDYVKDSDGNICALYIGEWESPFTVFRVHLLLGRNHMRELMRRFKKQYPLLQAVKTGRHQKKQGQLRSSYSDETVEKVYSPTTFKLLN